MSKHLELVFKRSVSVFVFALAASCLPANASSANWLPSNLGLRTLPDAMQQNVDGVVVTARGYVAEFDSTTSQIFGPFPTTFSDDHQIFGNLTAGADPARSDGLGLYVAAAPGINPSGLDYNGTQNEGYIDSGICPTSECRYLSDNPDVPGPPRPKMDFVMITFSQAVNVSSFTTTSANDWWAAGWTSQPNLGAGLEGALASASAIQVRGIGVGAQQNHLLQSFQSVVSLLVAVLPPVDGFGVRKLDSPGHFALGSVEFTPAVPEPSAVLLLLSGLGFISLVRARIRARRA